MASREQIKANQNNSKWSIGPRKTERTRFNRLKHGLRAEQVVLPGEDRADFEAELRAFFDDWKPQSHTRAVLVERMAVASWRLRRAVRAEATRLYEAGADVAHDFDLAERERVEFPLRRLPQDPGSALAHLRSSGGGIDRLIGLWEGLTEAAEPSGRAWGAEDHDRLLNLLGHPSGSEPEGLEVGRISRALLAAPRPGARPGGPAVESAAAELRAFCAERVAELRRERVGFWDPPVLRQRLVDAACASVTKERQLMHRYEMEHEKSLRASIRQLLALEKSGADLAEGPEPDPEPEASPEAAPEAAGAAPAGTEASEKCDITPDTTKSCTELASVGAAAPGGVRPARSMGTPGRPGGPIGAAPGPGMAPVRS